MNYEDLSLFTWYYLNINPYLGMELDARAGDGCPGPPSRLAASDYARVPQCRALPLYRFN